MVEDAGSESLGVVAGPLEAQPMQLVLEVGRFCDDCVEVLVIEDCPDDAMFLAIRVPRALVLAGALRPIGVRGIVADLRPWEFQVRANFLPECKENLNGHPI